MNIIYLNCWKITVNYKMMLTIDPDCYEKVLSIFKTGKTLKCRNAITSDISFSFVT